MRLPEYDTADATELASWVARGDVHPRELVAAALERIEARNGALNAVVHIDAERALDAAERLPDGPFRGVPFLLKDLGAEDAGQPCTSSCAPMKDWRAPRDSEIVTRYKAAGLNVVGRTNAPELGIYGVTESRFRGPCRNPWDTTRTPGGSSGGSGSAVAARMVPVAHAGDGGGSIRIPAAHCGLFGLKPSRGRVPMGPYISESWGGLVVQHVVARSVRDSAALLDCTAGPEVGAPYGVERPERPFLQEVGRDPGTLRIAWTAEPLFGGTTDPENRTAVEEAARQLEALGHVVEERLPPFDREALVRAYLSFVAVGTASELQGIGAHIGRPVTASEVEPVTWLLSRIGHKLTAMEMQGHREAMYAAGRAMGAFFAQHDVLVTPTCAVPPVPIGTFTSSRAELLQLGLLRTLDMGALYRVALEQLAADALSATANTMLFNLTGQPAVSMPLHASPHGLPIGVQAVGRYGDEATLLRLAAQLEPSFVSGMPPGLG
ncbi:MAG: amidase [Myxococcales bacterium]|nr:amidase [Myxococcales bacterium]